MTAGFVSDHQVWLTLSQLSSVSPAQWTQLCKTNSLTLQELYHLTDKDLINLGISQKTVAKMQKSKERASETVDYLSQHLDTACLYFGGPNYPNSLKSLSHPPAVLFLKGNVNALMSPQIAIVGSRQASQNGMRITEQISYQLCEHQLSVTSGLARGIDSAAHKGAICSGQTIAVLGSGVDVCYPKYNCWLYEAIINSGGAIVSEFFPGTPPRPHHFPCRNRLVAGLSLGVMVVEAKIRSGSLITANLAADLGKEVFAIPGNISHPLSEGVNWLIQQGAKLVTNVSDILEELQIQTNSVKVTESDKNHLAIDPILDSVDYDVTPLDSIIKRNKLSQTKILTVLLDYELRGLVASVPGGYLKLRDK